MTVKLVRRNVGVLCMSLSLVLSLGLLADVSGQVSYSPEEYDNYQTAVNAAVAEREGKIVDFIKKYPTSALVPHVVGTYVQLMADYEKRGQIGKVLSAGENLLSVQSDELNTLNMTAVAAYKMKQFSKAVRYGEKVYAKKPSSGLAFLLANSYGQVKNEAKYIQFGEKACAELPVKDCYAVLGELTRIFARKTQWSKAAGYAQKAVAGFEAVKKPSQVSQKDWDDYVTREKAAAYAVIGRYSAGRRRWGSTVTNYTKALNLYSSRPMAAEAYYYIGMARWKQNRIDEAMTSFAKGAGQRRAPHARPCREHLETLYKSTHNDSLAGIEEFMSRAK